MLFVNKQKEQEKRTVDDQTGVSYKSNNAYGIQDIKIHW